MQLGYLVLGVRDLATWSRFANEVLGLTVSRRDADGTLGLRLDGHAWRFLVVPGDDDLVAAGWELADDDAFDAVVSRCAAAGFVVRTDEELRRHRQVRRLAWLHDPGGVCLELVVGMPRADTPFSSPLVPGGFLADDLGLGHFVARAPDREASRRFYAEVMGLRWSDDIVCDVHGHPVDIRFFHVPGAASRHHSLAVGGPMEKSLHHFMVEARDLDDVGAAWDRALTFGCPIQQTVGRHPNDRMVSFYARTPSGFEFEFGWGGRLVDDAGWSPVVYDHISEWGHTFPAFINPRRRP